MKLKSKSFKPDSPIPRKFSAEGEGVSPQLSWTGTPPTAQEFAIICQDPDAPLPHPFVHWIVYGIPTSVSSLSEGEASIFKVGKNSLLTHGYTGPNPPSWHGAHRYEFRLYALDAPLDLEDGAGREEFFKAIDGHVIRDTKLTGTYRAKTAWLLPAVGVGAVALGGLLWAKKIAPGLKSREGLQ